MQLARCDFLNLQEKGAHWNHLAAWKYTGTDHGVLCAGDQTSQRHLLRLLVSSWDIMMWNATGLRQNSGMMGTSGVNVCINIPFITVLWIIVTGSYLWWIAWLHFYLHRLHFSKSSMKSSMMFFLDDIDCVSSNVDMLTNCSNHELGSTSPSCHSSSDDVALSCNTLSTTGQHEVCRGKIGE